MCHKKYLMVGNGKCLEERSIFLFLCIYFVVIWKSLILRKKKDEVRVNIWRKVMLQAILCSCLLYWDKISWANWGTWTVKDSKGIWLMLVLVWKILKGRSRVMDQALLKSEFGSAVENPRLPQGCASPEASPALLSQHLQSAEEGRRQVASVGFMVLRSQCNEHTSEEVWGCFV